MARTCVSSLGMGDAALVWRNRRRRVGPDVPRPVLIIAPDVAINSISDDVLVPKVCVQLKVRSGVGQRVTKPMMKEDMVHSILPALDAVMGLEDYITEATPIRSRGANVAEMGQAMEDPFFVARVCEILEAEEEVERTL